MATNDIRRVITTTPNQIRFFITGSFSPADAATNWTIGTPTDFAITLASLANGGARQSIKADLGASFAPEYAVFGTVDFTGETPTQGLGVDYYWAPSTHATQANANVVGNDGADAAAASGGLGSATAADMLAVSLFIGRLPTHDGASVQNGYVGSFSPPSRYGQLVVLNSSGDAFEADDVEMHTVFNPLIDQIQAAV